MTPRAHQVIALAVVVLAVAWLGSRAAELVIWPTPPPAKPVLLAAVRPTHSLPPPADLSTDGQADASADFLLPADPPTSADAAQPMPAGVTAATENASRVRRVWMRVTAYCPCKACCGRWAGSGKTASGASVRSNGGRFVAADTRLFPFGTKVRVPGYADGRFVPVLDRGRVIQGRRLDVFFPTHAQAKQWGVQVLLVEVLDE